MRLRLPGLLIWLVIVWILLWGEVSVANVLSGLVVSILIVVGSGIGSPSKTEPDDRARVSPIHLALFAFFVLAKLVQSNLALARVVMIPGNRIRSGVLAIELRSDQPLVMITVANVITLTPGTMTLESKGSPATLYVNVLQLHDPEAVRRDVADIELRAVKAFGSRKSREQLLSPTKEQR